MLQRWTKNEPRHKGTDEQNRETKQLREKEWLFSTKLMSFSKTCGVLILQNAGATEGIFFVMKRRCSQTKSSSSQSCIALITTFLR
jgi:hypothetical protein